jgi:hypothetical protein
MAEFFPPVLFEIKAKATEAIATFGEVNKELAKMEKNGVLASGSLGKMEKASKLAGAAILGLGGAFAAFGIASVKTLDTVEKSQANLEIAVKNTGVSFAAAKPIIDEHAKAMMALGFTYNDTYGALAKMTAASGSPQLALDSLGAAADLARFKQISLAEAGTLVARASIGQAKGLGDLGLALGKTIPKGATFAQILKAIESRAGGAAYQFKNTLSGSIQVAQANFQALEVQVGTKLVPTLTKLTNWITNTGIPDLEKLFKFISDHKKVFEGLGVALAVIWAVPKVAGIVSAIGTMIKAYQALRDAAAAAAIADAFATGGISVAAATAALAGAAAVYGGFLLNKDLSSGGGAKKVAATTPKATVAPNLAGRGVTRYDTATTKGKGSTAKKPTLAQQKRGIMSSGNVTVNINGAQNPTATGKAVVKAIQSGGR